MQTNLGQITGMPHAQQSEGKDPGMILENDDAVDALAQVQRAAVRAGKAVTIDIKDVKEMADWLEQGNCKTYNDATGLRDIQPEPSTVLKSLQSARKIMDLAKMQYPDGISQANVRPLDDQRFTYNKAFLLQFQPVFKEKPSMSWDAKIKEFFGS